MSNYKIPLITILGKNLQRNPVNISSKKIDTFIESRSVRGSFSEKQELMNSVPSPSQLQT